MKLDEKLFVMLMWIRNALSLLLIRIPMALPFLIFGVVGYGLFAMLAQATGDRETARDSMNCISKTFTSCWEIIKQKFSAKEILNDYYEMDRPINEEEP